MLRPSAASATTCSPASASTVTSKLIAPLRATPANAATGAISSVRPTNLPTIGPSSNGTETSPSNLNQVGLGVPPEGYALNEGEGAKALNRIFQVNVTATGGGSTAELEAKLTRTEVEGSGY